jgi:hypothetical protein
VQPHFGFRAIPAKAALVALLAVGGTMPLRAADTVALSQPPASVPPGHAFEMLALVNGKPQPKLVVWSIRIGGVALPDPGVQTLEDLGNGTVRCTAPRVTEVTSFTIRAQCGEAFAEATFSVDPAQGRPHLVKFEPASGSPGDPILISGSGLEHIKGVAFGTTPAKQFQASGDGKLYVNVPAGAVDGKIQVENDFGPSVCDTEFRVRHPAPRLLLFSPKLAPAGTEVLLTGTSFTPDLKVSFGGAPATELTVHSLTQATVKVPPGFTHGKLALVTAGGAAESATEFRIGMAPDLAVAEVMITQGSQTPGMTVPLVADRDAFCMVALVAHGPNPSPPLVRVRIRTPEGKDSFNEIIQPPTGLNQVPLAADPANLATLWTVPIPGKALKPSHSWLEVRVYPAGSNPEVASAIARWPGPREGTAGLDARLLDVRQVAPLEVTLIPLIQDGEVGNVDTPPRKLEDWAARFKAMFPVAGVVVKKGHPFPLDKSFQPGDLRAMWSILQHLEAQRQRDGKKANQIYYGVFKTRSAMDFGGMGMTPFGHLNLNRCAMGGDWEGAFPEDNRRFTDVFAHEMGHVLGCQHAPSAPPDFPVDLSHSQYPYPKADIGAFGFDVAARVLKAPGSFKDVMSYTPPCWISDYHTVEVLYLLEALAR